MFNLHRVILAVQSKLAIIVRTHYLESSPNAKLSNKLWDRYRELPAVTGCKTQITYVWIDGTGEFVRSKCRTFDFVPSSFKDCPNTEHDGTSTYLAVGNPSDILLCPVALYSDPMFAGNAKLVLCETYDLEAKPTCTNHRNACAQVLTKCCEKEPMFGLEQEYQLMDTNGRPLGWPQMGEPCPPGPYYCGVGARVAWGRQIADAHYKACLFAGVDIYSTNAEVTPGQWEFATGPTLGLKAADDLWIARYLLWRVAEDFGVDVSLHPKLFPNWNGAGCHVNFSTKEMREDNGLKFIEEAVANMEKTHGVDVQYYDPHGGRDNALRLTGLHATSSFSKFTWGIADRGASVRVLKRVADDKKGHLEDRRPAANCDPYQVMKCIVNTACLGSCQKEG